MNKDFQRKLVALAREAWFVTDDHEEAVANKERWENIQHQLHNSEVHDKGGQAACDLIHSFADGCGVVWDVARVLVDDSPLSLEHMLSKLTDLLDQYVEQRFAIAEFNPDLSLRESASNVVAMVHGWLGAVRELTNQTFSEVVIARVLLPMNKLVAIENDINFLNEATEHLSRSVTVVSADNIDELLERGDLPDQLKDLLKRFDPRNTETEVSFDVSIDIPFEDVNPEFLDLINDLYENEEGEEDDSELGRLL